jgi:large subunit ribosomal protein L21
MAKFNFEDKRVPKCNLGTRGTRGRSATWGRREDALRLEQTRRASRTEGNRKAPRLAHFLLVKPATVCDCHDSFPKAMAYAIIKTGGRQYRVAEGDTIDVDLLEGEAGQKMTFADVLMHADGDKLTHGSPSVAGASVTGEVVEQRKDKKVIAFKYRRRKGYHRTVGHRRKLTRVKITGISLGSKSKKAAASKEEVTE